MLSVSYRDFTWVAAIGFQCLKHLINDNLIVMWTQNKRGVSGQSRTRHISRISDVSLWRKLFHSNDRVLPGIDVVTVVYGK